MTEAAADRSIAGQRVLAEIRRTFFDSVLSGNRALLTADLTKSSTGAAYLSFLRVVHQFLQRRDASTDGRRARLYTTNYDVFLERALETLAFDYEDGFTGRLRPSYDPTRFGMVKLKMSASYGNVYETPSVDLRKLHGSVTWHLDGSHIGYSRRLSELRKLDELLTSAPPALPVGSNAKYQDLVEEATKLESWPDLATFFELYESLAIINPTSKKFESTVLDEHYYENLRALANDLDAKSTTLFVAGFSFADSHIREIVVRAADQNPTLTVIAFAYDKDAVMSIESLLRPRDRRNQNVLIQGPLTVPAGLRKRTVKLSLSSVTDNFFRPALPKSLA